MRTLAYFSVVAVVLAALIATVMLWGQQSSRKPVPVTFQTAKSEKIEMQWGAGSEADLGTARTQP
jgi:hypothetical protein